MIEYLINLSFGYLIGSIPSAYLLVKKKLNLDIREIGSGNVGARNAYEITRSKMVGFTILVSDVLKGTLAVWFSFLLFGENFWINSVSGIGAVLGHNYSIWIKFKGGRGLSTTAGVMLLLGWSYIVIWLLIYFISNVLVKQIHIAIVIATVLSPFTILLTTDAFRNSVLLSNVSRTELVLLSTILSILIVLKNIKPIFEYISNSRNKGDGQE